MERVEADIQVRRAKCIRSHRVVQPSQGEAALTQRSLTDSGPARETSALFPLLHIREPVLNDRKTLNWKSKVLNLDPDLLAK